MESSRARQTEPSIGYSAARRANTRYEGRQADTEQGNRMQSIEAGSA